MRTFIQISALILWLVLAFLTLYVLFNTGLDLLTALSLLVVAILGFGIFGAIGERPRKGGPL